MGVLCGAIGVSKISELEIDADKDWQARGITNLKEIAVGMSKGDLGVRGDSIILKLVPGTVTYVLTSAGPGNLPAWMPAPGPLEKWLPEWIELSHTESIKTVSHSLARPLAMTSAHAESYVDDPSKLIKVTKVNIGLSKTVTTGITPDHSITKPGAITTQYGIVMLVGGAVAEDGGVQTDETAQAKSPATNDMTLLSLVPVVDDCYYFGHANKFDIARVNIGQSGVGVWTITWEYWNGAWAALAGVNDGTNGFRAVEGWHDVSFTEPGDWALTTIQGMNLYWIRARVTSYTSITQQPLGTQAKIEIIGG